MDMAWFLLFISNGMGREVSIDMGWEVSNDMRREFSIDMVEGRLK